MPNTAKTPGNFDIKTFIETLSSTQAGPLQEVLELLYVHNNETHQRAVQLMGDLMDATGDVDSHPAHRFMELLTEAIARYEERIYPPVFNQASQPEKALAVLKYLMEAQNVKQADLADIFGSQGNVSQVLQGKREINLGHIRKLAERFHVSQSTFV